MEIILLIWAYYFFISKRSIGDDFIKVFKFIYRTCCNFFIPLFRFGVDSIKPRACEGKRTISNHKEKKSANSSKHKELVESRKKENCILHKNVSVTLSRANYCPVNEFYTKLENPLQRAIWRYYVDNNMPTDIQNHVVISLDKSAITPKKWDITEDCLAMNIPLVWKIIKIEHQRLSSKGMIPVILSLYSETSKKPA